MRAPDVYPRQVHRVRCQEANQHQRGRQPPLISQLQSGPGRSAVRQTEPPALAPVPGVELDSTVHVRIRDYPKIPDYLSATHRPSF